MFKHIGIIKKIEPHYDTYVREEKLFQIIHKKSHFTKLQNTFWEITKVGKIRSENAVTAPNNFQSYLMDNIVGNWPISVWYREMRVRVLAASSWPLICACCWSHLRQAPTSGVAERGRSGWSWIILDAIEPFLVWGHT